MRSWKNLGQEAQVAMYLKGRPRVDMEAAETSHATGVKWRVNTGSFTIITLKRHYVLTRIKLAKQKKMKKKTKHLDSTHPFFTQWNSKKLGFPNPMKRLPLTHAPISGHTFSHNFQVQKLHHFLSSTKVQTIDLTARVDAILWHHQAPGDKAERNSSESKGVPWVSKRLKMFKTQKKRFCYLSTILKQPQFTISH